MIHPHTELRFISPQIGYGVVANQRIPKGTITWALDKLDRLFSPREVEHLSPLYRNIIDKYCFRNNKGEFVLCWDNGRYVNHSFKSNCLTTAYDFEIAIRDIEPGEELTDDYGYLNITEPFQAFHEKGSKRTTVFPDDLLHHAHHWDRKLKAAFPDIMAVDQPLKDILSKDVWDIAMQVARGARKMDSIKNCYFRPSISNANGSTSYNA